MKQPVTLTLRRTDAGLALVLPDEWVRALGLSDGDEIAVAPEAVTLNANPSDNGLMAFADDYMTRHREAFEELAK
jgi:hypothetical protein